MVFAVAILLAVGALAFTLFVRTQDIPEPVPESPTRYVEERRAQILDNLRDLAFEFRVGKLSDEDYQRTKLELQTELAKTMAEIDALKPVEAVSAKPVPSPAKKPDGKTCPHCGAAFAKRMKFCGECGKAMA